MMPRRPATAGRAPARILNSVRTRKVRMGLSALNFAAGTRQTDVMSARRDDAVLGPSECLELLAQVEIGRIALSVDALPVILPVAFALVDEQIHFWSMQDSKLDAAVDNRVVAFESGAFEPEAGTGWSVLIQGMTQVLHESDSTTAPFQPPSQWDTSEDRHRMIRIQPRVITGQRILIMSPTPTSDAAPDVPFLHLSSRD